MLLVELIFFRKLDVLKATAEEIEKTSGNKVRFLYSL